MLKRLKCRLKGHQFTCTQMITLLPDDTGILDHAHTCTRCPKVKTFAPEPVEDEMIQMLLGLVGPSKIPTSMNVESPIIH